jgi:hypothetical protein
VGLRRRSRRFAAERCCSTTKTTTVISDEFTANAWRRSLVASEVARGEPAGGQVSTGVDRRLQPRERRDVPSRMTKIIAHSVVDDDIVPRNGGLLAHHWTRVTVKHPPVWLGRGADSSLASLGHSSERSSTP